MARRVNDLDSVNIQGAANQVNTFVYGPRAEKENTATMLADALNKGVEGLAKYKEMETKIDVAQATENKLYGGTLYTNSEAEGIADYDEVKESLGSMEAAEKYFIERTSPKEPITDPHVLSGFRESQAKGLGKFRGEHAAYLSKLKVETRSRDVLNDFFNEVSTTYGNKFPNEIQSPKNAFDRLGQIADNFGISKKDTNAIPLGVAEIMVAQGKLREAKEILNYNRGPAGSLLSNPETSLAAQKIKASIDTEDSVGVANMIKSLEDVTTAGNPYTDVQKAQLDLLLQNKDITIEKRNALLTKNDEAVKVSDTSKLLGSSLVDPNRNFFSPIQGLTIEQADKARAKFVEDYNNKLETFQASGRLQPNDYFSKMVTFAEKTDSTNKALKNRLSAGYAIINPAKVLETGQVDPSTIAGIGQYMEVHSRNPSVAARHVDEKALKFYDDIIMDVKFGGYTGSLEERINQAVVNYSRDTLNPIKTTGSVKVSDEDIITQLNSATSTLMGGTFGIGDSSIENAQEWTGIIRKQMNDAARRTGNVNMEDALEHITTQIAKRNIRIGNYLVPAGSVTVNEGGYIPATGINVNDLNESMTEDYVKRNPTSGYEADDLVIVPITGRKDAWGVSVKGLGQILEVKDMNQLPAKGGATKDILQDEGVKKNEKGEHISYNDTLGNLTGGYGHLMTAEEKEKYPEGTPIPQAQVDKWFAEDRAQADADVASIFGEVDNPEVKDILTNMAFNLGHGNLNEFSRLKKAIADKDYKLAAKSMRESKWAKQVGNRSTRLIERMEAQA